eukprot:1277658-Amphidinium_carterae.2
MAFLGVQPQLHKLLVNAAIWPKASSNCDMNTKRAIEDDVASSPKRPRLSAPQSEVGFAHLPRPPPPPFGGFSRGPTLHSESTAAGLPGHSPDADDICAAIARKFIANTTSRNSHDWMPCVRGMLPLVRLTPERNA